MVCGENLENMGVRRGAELDTFSWIAAKAMILCNLIDFEMGGTVLNSEWQIMRNKWQILRNKRV